MKPPKVLHTLTPEEAISRIKGGKKDNVGFTPRQFCLQLGLTMNELTAELGSGRLTVAVFGDYRTLTRDEVLHGEYGLISIQALLDWATNQATPEALKRRVLSAIRMDRKLDA